MVGLGDLAHMPTMYWNTSVHPYHSATLSAQVNMIRNGAVEHSQPMAKMAVIMIAGMG